MFSETHSSSLIKVGIVGGEVGRRLQEDSIFVYNVSERSDQSDGGGGSNGPRSAAGEITQPLFIRSRQTSTPSSADRSTANSFTQGLSSPSSPAEFKCLAFITVRAGSP